MKAVYAMIFVMPGALFIRLQKTGLRPRNDAPRHYFGDWNIVVDTTSAAPVQRMLLLFTTGNRVIIAITGQWLYLFKRGCSAGYFKLPASFGQHYYYSIFFLFPE